MKTMWFSRFLSLGLLIGCASDPALLKDRVDDISRVQSRTEADKLFIVDCLVPGQIKKLGREIVILEARRPIKTDAGDCEIKGGQYTAYDRADSATSLKIWLPQAESGDPQAQAYAGEIYEKGLGTLSDYKIAAEWYRKAAEKGNKRAQINLGHLYEKGLGVEQNLATAMDWYRKASGLEETDISFAASVRTTSGDDQTAELDLLKRALENSRSQSNALNAQLADAQRQLQESLNKLQKQQVDREETQTKLDQQQSQGNSAESAKLENLLRQKDGDLNALKQQVARLDSQYQQKVTDLTQKLEVTEKRAKQIAEQLQKQQSVASASQYKMAEAEAKLADTEKKLFEAQQSVNQANADKVLLSGQAKTSSEMQQQLEQSKISISRLETEKQSLRQEIEKLKNAPAPINTAEKPVIEIIDPPLTLQRGSILPTVVLRSPVKEREIIGKADSPSGIMSVMVNDIKNRLERGIFRSTIGIQGDKTPVHIVAVDNNGTRSSLEFLLSMEGVSAIKQPSNSQEPVESGNPWQDVNFGNYYALIIGNAHYKKIIQLDTPINDAKAVDQVLKSKYGFKTKLLIDADRYQILTAMNELRAKLTENDNLLIYYAGHGELDKVNMRGHWLPVDADADNNANWISTVAITDILNAMSPRHILVVADSCYSGTLTRSSLARLEAGMSDDKKTEWVKTMLNRRSRVALTSGGLEPVADGGEGGHSIFANAFIHALQNNSGFLEGQELSRTVSAQVIASAEKIGISQVPQYDPLKFAGHEVGDFFFMPK